MRRNAALFVGISLLSGFGGSAMSLVTSVWLLDLTGSSSLAALAALCVYAPTLAGPWLGGLVDRVPRRLLVIGVNLGLAVTLLALFAVRGPAQAWIIYTVSLAYGLSYVLIDAGETALLPRALPPAELGGVNGWRSSAQEGMKLVAPAAGAGLYAWHGGRAVAVLGAIVPLVVAAMYAAVRLTRVPVGAAPEQRRGFRAGAAVLWEQRVVRVTVALAAVSIAMSGFQTAATYSMVISELALPATFLGVLVSAQGAGSIVGGLLAGPLITRYGPIAVGVTGTVVFGIALLARCLPWWPVAVATAVVAGVGLPWTLVAAVTAVQTLAPPALLGRVAATANTVMFAPIAAAVPFGSAVVHLGARSSLLGAGAACLLAAAAMPRTDAGRPLDRPRSGGTPAPH
ncbi:MAG TPA: MFS transporter [Actinoplanes sp.]